MVVKFKYIDKDYVEARKEMPFDTVTVSFPCNTDIKQLGKDFACFSENYMNGYTYGEELELCSTEEEFEEFERTYGVTVERAKHFAELRENGLSGDLVVSAFLKEYPEYNGTIATEDYIITFNEYDGCSKPKKTKI